MTEDILYFTQEVCVCERERDMKYSLYNIHLWFAKLPLRHIYGNTFGMCNKRSRWQYYQHQAQLSKIAICFSTHKKKCQVYTKKPTFLMKRLAKPTKPTGYRVELVGCWVPPDPSYKQYSDKWFVCILQPDYNSNGRAQFHLKLLSPADLGEKNILEFCIMSTTSQAVSWPIRVVSKPKILPPLSNGIT